jgi:hypothetical protein
VIHNIRLFRCYVEMQDGQWIGVCVDLSLAAQSDVREEALLKLHTMILEFVRDAKSGDDGVRPDGSLFRPAPLPLWMKYYWYYLLVRVGAARQSARLSFMDVFSLPVPASR